MRLSLAERFLLTRKRMDLTQAGMAHLLRVCRETVNRAEQGHKLESWIVERVKLLESRQRKGTGAGIRAKTPGYRRLGSQKEMAAETRAVTEDRASV